jgi:hypothetical protein
MEGFAKQLNGLKDAMGLRICEIAKAGEVSWEGAWLWLKGKRIPPKPRRMMLAKGLGLKEDFFEKSAKKT